MLTVDEMAGMIDHSILSPSQTDRDWEEGVRIAVKYRVKCVVPVAYRAARTAELLKGSGVWLCVPISFPQGLNPPEVKRHETEVAVRAGAREVDMVINISALKSGQYEFVEDDIRGVVEVAGAAGVAVKAILETYLLTDQEKAAACHIAERAGVAFVKTSTQTQPGGATVEDIRLMRAAVGPSVMVKASGYITDVDKALALYEAGARRFGTGYTISILEGLRRVTAGVPSEAAPSI